MPNHSGRGHRGEAGTGAEPADPVVGRLFALERRLTAIEQVVGEVRDVLRHQAVEKVSYSTTELAEAMGVSVFTVTERWCNAGRIECEKDPDTGRWRIPGPEFQRLVRGGALGPRRK